MISKSEWNDWRTNNVTRAFFAAADQRIEDAKDILAESAGLNPDQDNFFRGFIQAYVEMQGFKVEDVEE